MLLFAVITILLLIWSVVLTTRVMYVAKIVAELKALTEAAPPALGQYEAAVARAEASLAGV